jgi:uncharacterized protein
MHLAAVCEAIGLGAGSAEICILAAVVMVLSVVQGLFGVGLLVFGTPTLLLLGYPFQEALAYLLPSSVLISALQTVQGRRRIELHRSLGFALPPLLVGLALVLTGVVSIDIKLLVGSLMVLSVAVRLCDPLKSRLQRSIRGNTGGYLALTGLLHGLTNMGGALLTILAATLFESKETIRANIACCYLMFGISQLAVLALFQAQALTLASLMLAAIALLTYGTLVQLIYLKTSEARYQAFITILMLCYGLALIGNRLLS